MVVAERHITMRRGPRYAVQYSHAWIARSSLERIESSITRRWLHDSPGSSFSRGQSMMQRLCRSGLLIAMTAWCALVTSGAPARADGPYKVIKKAKVGGDGGF